MDTSERLHGSASMLAMPLPEILSEFDAAKVSLTVARMFAMCLSVHTYS